MADIAEGRDRSESLIARTLASVRDADWLTPERAKAYSLILLIIMSATALVWAVMARSGLDPLGKPLGTDFSSFWTASKLALSGHPLSAYDPATHHKAQTVLFGHDVGYYAFFYPPIFLLICLPLALLPYPAALAAWLAAMGFAYWKTVRAFAGDKLVWWAALAFPAVFTTIEHGQNAFLSTALIGAGVLWMDRRPVIAGLCIGALIYKPHLGIVLPFVLLASFRWKVILGACISATALIAASTTVFGLQIWRAFLATSPMAKATLEQHVVGDAKMQSVFAAVRLLHGSLGAAYVLQALAALGATAGVIVLQRRVKGSGAEGPLIVMAALLASPFLLDYDLALMAIPLAWMTAQGLKTGFLPWEKIGLLAAFLLPAVSRNIAMTIGLPLAPPVLAALYGLVMRRGLASPRSCPIEPRSSRP